MPTTVQTHTTWLQGCLGMGVASGWPSSELMLVVVACFATLLPYDGVGMARIVHSTQSPQCEPWSSVSRVHTCAAPELAKRAFPWQWVCRREGQSVCVCVCSHTVQRRRHHQCHHTQCTAAITTVHTATTQTTPQHHTATTPQHHNTITPAAWTAQRSPQPCGRPFGESQPG